MKVREKYAVPNSNIYEFLSNHIDETIIVNSVTSQGGVIFSIEQDYTESELHMFHLRKFVESGDATPEEQNAAEYAINAIKTLMDMGVLK